MRQDKTMIKETAAPKQKLQDDPVADLAQADVAASQAMAAASDPWVDLARAGSESEILMARLTDRFTEINKAYLATIGSDPAAMQGVLHLLARQLARAQADIFVLKSAVLGRDRLVLTQDWDYRDPLASHARLLSTDGMTAMWQRTGHYRLPLDDSLMGFGWYPPEGNGRTVWRWSGPGTTSTLFVPRFFVGRIKVEIAFNSVRRGVMPAAGGLTADGTAVDYVLSHADDKTTHGKLEFTLDLGGVPAEAEGAAAFLPLEFALVRTYSPAQELGKSDKRELGICLREVTISVA